MITTVTWLLGHKKSESGQLLWKSNRRWGCLDLMRVVDVVGSGLFPERVEDAVFRTGDERPIKDNFVIWLSNLDYLLR